MEETLQLADQWLKRTDYWMNKNLRTYKIGKTGQLKQSIRTKLTTNGNTIVGTIQFRMSGKYADMGAGRGQKANTRTTKRQAKKWVNRLLFARVRNLQQMVRTKQIEEMKKRFMILDL